MRLADYIETHADAIVDEAETFARTRMDVPVQLDRETLRDHLPEILDTIVADLRGSQSDAEERARARGDRDTPASSPMSAAQWHGKLRAQSGFSIDLLVAEFRALRASVLRLWGPTQAASGESFEDMMRFNQAIDQAIAESVAYHAAEAESWRNIFLGVLGHDLRGPLTSILLTSSLMSRMTMDAPLSRLNQRVIMSGERMSTLLDDLLDFSRSSLGVGIRIRRGEVDLAQALEDEVKMLRMAWPRARIHFRSGGPLHGNFDASRLREALANLVNNAVKHGDGDGDVQVSLGSDGRNVTVQVENTGSPIPDDLLATMFDPLRRGSHAPCDDTGLGLGLFVVREVARAHGGDVAVQSTSRGTTFTMELPLQPGQA